jgi:hypothetical protein
VLLPDRGWPVLIEAVASHAPIGPLRRADLSRPCASDSLGLVFVKAFPTLPAFLGFGRDVAWETEVWITDKPRHFIHRNGEPFLGPCP